MGKDEKENRINSLALTFLERQQIQPNIFADQIIKGYKEGYHQAEEDLKLTWEDIADILDVTDIIANDDSMEDRLETMSEEEYCQEVLKRFKERKRE